MDEVEYKAAKKDLHRPKNQAQPLFPHAFILSSFIACLFGFPFQVSPYEWSFIHF